MRPFGGTSNSPQLLRVYMCCLASYADVLKLVTRPRVDKPKNVCVGGYPICHGSVTELVVHHVSILQIHCSVFSFFFDTPQSL